MSNLKRQTLGKALAAAIFVFAALQGCNDDNDNAKPPDVTSGGSNTTAGKSNQGGKAGKGGDTSTAGSSNQGGTTGNEGGTTGNEGGSSSTVGGGDEGGAGGAAPGPACTLPELGEDGCFNCPHNGNVEQWLNRCSDGDCEPFDNKARLPKLKADGTVPPLDN
jgi:hypothetical protein